MEIRIIAQTKDCESFSLTNMNKDAMEFAGKNAGICYMPDDYTSEGINDTDACLKRAKFNIKSGHYSVFEHYHITFLMEDIPKMMAMILNSTRLYNTSEKSARYTKMKPETELEEELYNKWCKKFTDILLEKHPELTGNEITKLAQENARYLISVFTPTTMSFTVPYSRAILLIDWLKDFKIWPYKFSDTIFSTNNNHIYSSIISKKLISVIEEFIDKFSEALEVDQNNLPLTDHKKMGITLFSGYNMSVGSCCYKLNKIDEQEHYGSVYYTKYFASLACVAQLQRHRTINYNISFIDMTSSFCYIPNIIFDDVELSTEWEKDFDKLINANILPQGQMVSVEESGNFLDFYAKCKERLCTRAQIEIRENTVETAKRFLGVQFKYSDLVEDMFYYDEDEDCYKVRPRCQFNNYTCKEPCKRYCKDCLYSLDI